MGNPHPTYTQFNITEAHGALKETRGRCGHTNRVCICGTSSSIHGSHEVETHMGGPIASTMNLRPVDCSQLPQISELFWIPAKYRSLLVDFIQHASGAGTCCVAARNRSNQLMIPRALQSPSLLKCILAWAAGHQVLCCQQPEEKSKREVVHRELLRSSLLSLQVELRDSQRQNKIALIASSLMLCLQKLFHEELESRSWRIHLDGARTILLAAIDTSYDDPDDLELLNMLSRWYQAVESLAALTSCSLSAEQIKYASSSSFIRVSTQEGEYLDEYCGYSFKLNEILRRIGVAGWQRRTRPKIVGQVVGLSSEDFETEADLLDNALRSIMDESRSSPPSFYPGVAKQLAPREIQDFVLCNEAYQHLAFIHIQRRVRNLPSSIAPVQASVKRILECSTLMAHTSEPSPWIALTGPLFTAGCSAIGEDRGTTRGLLQALYSSTQSVSVRRALLILESFWADDYALDYYDWEALPGMPVLLTLKKYK